MEKIGNCCFFTFKRQFVVKLEKLDNAKYTLKLSVGIWSKQMDSHNQTIFANRVFLRD